LVLSTIISFLIFPSTAPSAYSTLSLHDALPICLPPYSRQAGEVALGVANRLRRATTIRMTAMSFAHLHLHTEYAKLDGAARSKDVVRTAAEDGQTGVGITDHGVLYGVVDFVKAAKSHDLTPVIGIEAYFTEGSRFDRPVGAANQRYHLLLYAENETGYKNLMKLSSRAFLEGYYYKP